MVGLVRDRFERRLSVDTYIEMLSKGYAYTRRDRVPRKYRDFEDILAGLGLVDVRSEKGGGACPAIR